MHQRHCRIDSRTLVTMLASALLAGSLAPSISFAQQASISAWEAAEFRTWSFIPYWTTQSQLNSFATDHSYDHVSDILYFSGVQPREDGSLFTSTTAANHLSTLKSHQAQFGFRYHMSMFDPVRLSPQETSTAAVERVWNGITANPDTRAKFVNNVKNLLTANNMTGFNLDWERPDIVTEWANYTQLAKDMQAAFPESWEVSVDDYGFASTIWDDTPVFDGRTYDQLFVMAYHANASQYNTYSNTKLNLTGQGAEKAFKNNQLVLGIGTYGSDADPDNNPELRTVSLKNIVAVNPNLPADATTFTGTVTNVQGNLQTGTWTIQSRYQTRDIVQLALDRGMPGVMNWTLHYDATNQFGLHRVAHHYIVVKRNVPDLNLDGKVNAADANALANNMGTVPGWTGTNTPARFETFYMNGNWEKGDRDGNGFVNQADADWLATRYAALGVNLPDRLAYSGTFENFAGGQGVAGRWEVIRNGGNLPETGNFTQHGTGFLNFTGGGVGATKRSNTSVTLRNQNSAEAFDNLNTANRVMQVELAEPVDTASTDATYFTALVRQNTAGLLAAQVASTGRTLALEFRDAAGVNQFDVALFGSQSQFGLRSQADAAGEDVTSANGFNANTTYMLVGKLSGNGAGANTLQVSLVDWSGSIGNFTDPAFAWMLTATGSEGFNPTITDLAWNSPSVANYTVSNVWVGGASDFFFQPGDFGDFNWDGVVDAADYSVWRDGMGTLYDQDDYEAWKAHFGETVGNGSAAGTFANGVPEPSSAALLLAATFLVFGRFSLIAYPRRR
jgi:hypothetical protein